MKNKITFQSSSSSSIHSLQPQSPNLHSIYYYCKLCEQISDTVHQIFPDSVNRHDENESNEASLHKQNPRMLEIRTQTKTSRCLHSISSKTPRMWQRSLPGA
eukprot:TRINITY_DN6891_c2_g1_i1.p1 TRINITY_DN6891_c2_g1~~TRINITY_DN6891_c2_g1_i1.p1  ORF type:complete len:102 (+),score=10.15 TRINITY_DN6891_c2_g1_i1:266-571(+)